MNQRTQLIIFVYVLIPRFVVRPVEFLLGSPLSLRLASGTRGMQSKGERRRYPLAASVHMWANAGSLIKTKDHAQSVR